jgi:hypothetical protein
VSVQKLLELYQLHPYVERILSSNSKHVLCIELRTFIQSMRQDQIYVCEGFQWFVCDLLLIKLLCLVVFYFIQFRIIYCKVRIKFNLRSFIVFLNLLLKLLKIVWYCAIVFCYFGCLLSFLLNYLLFIFFHVLLYFTNQLVIWRNEIFWR